MSNSNKKLCKWKKDKLKKDLEDYAPLVEKAKYVCENCGRAARKKKSVCKPVKLP